MIASARQSGCLNGITECPLSAAERALRLKLIIDFRAVTLELAVHPKVCLVVPNGAGEIWRNQSIARGANRASGDRDLLVRELARADTDDATPFRGAESRQHPPPRGPQAVWCQ